MEKVLEKEAIKTDFEVSLPNGEQVTVSYGVNNLKKPDYIGKHRFTRPGVAAGVRVIGCANDVGFDTNLYVARAADSARSIALELVALAKEDLPKWSKKMRLVVTVSLEEE